MAELHGVSRHLSYLAVFLALVFAVALAPGSAMASAPTGIRVSAKGPLPVPGAFRLSASNGYSLYVVSIPPYAKQPGGVMIFADAKGKGVTYKAPAIVTETSIQADLGDLGKISVTFQRSSSAASVRCGDETIRFDSGSYEGTIDFHGEEGYTAVEATSAPGALNFWFAAACGESSLFSEGFSERPRGATLHVRNPALGQEMSVSKRRPGAAAQIAAWVSEYSNGISIRRFTSLRMPGEAFTYDRRLRTASVHPPSPFAGSARFDLRTKAGKRWSGDLTVDLPGKAGVPLTGTSLRATLIPSE